MAEPFFDTNILLCLMSEDAAKAKGAVQVMDSPGVISVQVLNEFVAVARRRFGVDWNRIEALLDGFRSYYRVVDLTHETHDRAVRIARRYGLEIYDANIVAAAILAGCDTVLSEDMQDGQVIGGVTIRNPFL